MRLLRPLLLTAGLVGACIAFPTAHAAAPPAPLTNVQVDVLAGVQRRMDHFAVDPAGQRLFVAALGNRTLEVVDVAGGKRITSIPRLNEPQGVAYLPALQRIVVATRAGGTVTAFDDAGSSRTRCPSTNAGTACSWA
jgi:YVTN family beta-propeller protein